MKTQGGLPQLFRGGMDVGTSWQQLNPKGNLAQAREEDFLETGPG